jgi:hypothetical protein
VCLRIRNFFVFGFGQTVPDGICSDPQHWPDTVQYYSCETVSLIMHDSEFSFRTKIYRCVLSGILYPNQKWNSDPTKTFVFEFATLFFSYTVIM